MMVVKYDGLHLPWYQCQNMFKVHCGRVMYVVKSQFVTVKDNRSIAQVAFNEHVLQG
jgi:hypothetical protein